MSLNIAIDGPSGAGKSTMSKILAEKLNIVYLDTGAMYRGLAFYALKRGVEPDNEEKVKEILPSVNMDIRYENGSQNVYVSGENVTPFIREHNISMAASTISKIPAVRIKLVELQRSIAEKCDCVLDGRDIGTYVLPNAKHKIFLTAASTERAERRFKELKQKNTEITYEEVLKDVEARDLQDTTRSFAPLKPADDAVILDTTGLSIQQAADAILNIVCK